MKGNDNFTLTVKERENKLALAEKSMGEFFDILGFDWRNDPQMQETPKRIAKMYIDELCKGNFTNPPDLKVFPNTKKYDEIVVSGPISVKSMCSHHFMPFSGDAYIGYLPDKKVIGLSKFSRIVDWFSRRPQIQEELTMQIADYLEKHLKPQGLIIIIKAQHYCMLHRGVNEKNSWMYTSVVRGHFRTNDNLKKEFFDLIKE